MVRFVAALVYLAIATAAMAQTTRPVSRGAPSPRDAEALSTKIVYVADTGASMQAVIPSLRDQMKQSIGGLVANQFFNLVLFSGDEAITFNSRGVVIANPDNKTKAYDWIDKIEAKAGSNPIPAI